VAGVPSVAVGALRSVSRADQPARFRDEDVLGDCGRESRLCCPEFALHLAQVSLADP
jgi:hypothetical protein